MQLFLDIVQLVTAVLLMGTILIQSKGEGLGAAFGGGSNIVATRRGPEKVVFILSIIFSTVFIVLAALRLFL